MNLLRKYYDKDSIGGGIPDEVEKMLEEKFRLPTEKELGDFVSIEDAISHMATQNLCLAASKYGYSLASEKLKEKDEEISRLKEENERLRGEVDIPTAIIVLTKALLEDKSEGSYYYSWQANISMSFIDEYQRLNPHMSDGNKHILHGIANEAAKNFLDLLCLITPSPTTKK